MSVSNQTSELHILRRGAQPTGNTDVPLPGVRWKSRIVLPGLILLAMLVIIAWALRGVLTPTLEVQVVPVVAKNTANVSSTGSKSDSEVSLRDLPVVCQASGWLEAAPYSINVSALANGIIDKVLVLEGQTVKAGQVLVTMIDDDAKLEVQRFEAEYASAVARMKASHARLKAAQSDWDNPIERKRKLAVTEADLVEAKAELERLPSEIRVEQARCDELKDEANRMKLARKKGVATDFELKGADFRYESQLAKLQATQQTKAILEAKVKRLEAEVIAARKHLKLRIQERQALEEGKAAVAQAKADLKNIEVRLAEAKLRLSRMKVTSPVDGVVQQRLRSPGDKLMVQADVSTSAHVVSLYDPSKMQVRVDVPLADVAKVGVGQRAIVRVDMDTDREEDREFTGKLTRIVHHADIQKNTLEVKVAIDAPSALLKPEMLARVKFLARPASQRSAASDSTNANKSSGSPVDSGSMQRLFVPAALVEKTGQAEGFVWRVNRKDSTAEKVIVRLGRHGKDQWVQVRDGLNPGDRIIDADPQSLQAGLRVKIVGESSRY